ncbi:MAG: thioredoxin domain-containing protein [Desulfarculaceae bacterium]|nr:thioredoxin domain-containing protein [Desulfarculaceae bacterium]MCF8071956.1 thioredoxin domain-containing protein [Desulfarculaceae bacterium]MCF8101473.1 thioredoxin domain-containing protein [Desulfarculaceae bacterium]MCF8115023.1 thioredoxin domain-containing protein [Desulfarculaceae bacterium]
MVGKKACLWLAVAALGLAAAPAGAQAPSGEAIRQYLKAHPEVVLEILSQHKEELYQWVLQGRELKQRRTWRANIKKNLADPIKPEIAPDRPMLGKASAPILVVEYSDFLCPSCTRGAKNLERLMAKNPGTYRAILKHMPSGDLSRQLSLYFEAIGRQDPAKAWRYYREIFQRQDEVSKKGLKVALDIVKKLDLDQARLSRDLADPALAKRLKDDSAEGRKFKLGGTPSFVVSGVVFRGPAPVEAFEDLWYIKQGKEPPPLTK